MENVENLERANKQKEENENHLNPIAVNILICIVPVFSASQCVCIYVLKCEMTIKSFYLIKYPCNGHIILKNKK